MRNRHIPKPLVRMLMAFALMAFAHVPPSLAQWNPQTSSTKARLRGLDVVSDRVVWASGTQGTFVRTTDAGNTWRAGSVPGATELDFRDVEAFDDQRACLLSIGAGEKSRVFKTTDGGQSWKLLFTNSDPRAFLDAIAFWDESHGIAMGDPVDGRFTILTTDDAGLTWKPAPARGMPPALPAEGAFAASGTCLVVKGDRQAWFATGGAGVARVFRSADRGQSWQTHETPILAANASSGIFSLAFLDANRGVAVGGDYKDPSQTTGIVAWTSDGGRTWASPRMTSPAGYRSCAAVVPGAGRPIVVAVGPTGSDFSTDRGQSWLPLSKTGFHAVGFASPDAGWAVGDNGSIARFTRMPEDKPAEK
jgi:photosystem II stability/assembly factor-like uncharacterized protein